MILNKVEIRKKERMFQLLKKKHRAPEQARNFVAKPTLPMGASILQVMMEGRGGADDRLIIEIGLLGFSEATLFGVIKKNL